MALIGFPNRYGIVGVVVILAISETFLICAGQNNGNYDGISWCLFA